MLLYQLRNPGLKQPSYIQTYMGRKWAAKAEGPVRAIDPIPTPEPQRGPWRIIDKVKPLPEDRWGATLWFLMLATAASIYGPIIVKTWQAVGRMSTIFETLLSVSFNSHLVSLIGMELAETSTIISLILLGTGKALWVESWLASALESHHPLFL